MKGLIETIVEAKYGAPSVHRRDPFYEFWWNEDDDNRRCVLYKDVGDSTQPMCSIPHEAKLIYGDMVGGFLLHDSLRIAMLRGPEVFGLYQLPQLQGRPEVTYASELLPKVFYFMDAANVWFYGVSGDNLYVYDSDPNELDCLGPLESAIGELIDLWGESGSASPNP